MRAAIAKYSPYQNVLSEKTYPEVFFVTSTKDDRVTQGTPGNGGKNEGAGSQSVLLREYRAVIRCGRQP